MTDSKNGEWYTNKEIFEQLQNFKNDFIDLSQDLTKEMYDMRQEISETKMLIKEYNGLRKDIDNTKNTVIACQRETPNNLKKEIKTEVQEDLKANKKKIEDLETKMTKLEASLKTLKVVFGGAVTLAGIVIAVLQYFKG